MAGSERIRVFSTGLRRVANYSYTVFYCNRMYSTVLVLLASVVLLVRPALRTHERVQHEYSTSSSCLHAPRRADRWPLRVHEAA